jgi:hypothetical protein
VYRCKYREPRRSLGVGKELLAEGKMDPKVMMFTRLWYAALELYSIGRPDLGMMCMQRN